MEPVYDRIGRRPEAYLDPAVRSRMSGLAQLDPAAVDAGIGRLRRDLRSGAWRERYADLLARDELDAGYRLVVAGEPMRRASVSTARTPSPAE